MRRKAIPEALTDLGQWPGVDPGALPGEERKRYRAREQAIQAYFANKPVAWIEKRFGIARGSLAWLVTRCLAAHPDGRIQGFRGLIPYRRVKRYARVKPARRDSRRGGLAGALRQLLERHPSLADVLERRIAQGELGLTENGRLYGLIDAHTAFVAASRALGLTAADYPLNQDERAYRSLARLARERLEGRVPIRPSSGRHLVQRATLRPFSLVELDGHKLDIRLRVRFTEPSGLAIDLETERIFVLCVMDVCTRAILGWQLVLAPEYDRFDVLLALQNALRPRRKRERFEIAELNYSKSAGFVSEVSPRCAYACWEMLKFDNARAHLAEDTLNTLCEFVGCQIDAGPVGEPTQRACIERFFRTLTDRLVRRLPGTTGNRPADPAGKRGRAVAVEHLVTIQEIEELLEVTIANYNGSAHDGLQGKTPLEAVHHLTTRSAMPVRTLPAAQRERLHQLQPAHLSTVRGSPARGIAPYISLYGARYSNDILARSSGLLRTQIRIYMNPDDMREAWAYLPNGAGLGRLNILSGWRFSRHTLRLRQHILRLRRLSKLQFTEQDDPVAVFARYQRARARRSSRKESTRTAQIVASAAAPAAVPGAARRSRGDSPIVPTPLPDLDVQNY